MGLKETVMLWLLAAFYAAMVILDILRKVWKFGPRAVFQWKEVEKPTCLDDPTLGTHGFLHLENVRIHYVASGPEDKPLMLFLHGFPEFWFSWRHQIREFQKDYRVVAVDMRGYGDSDKPAGIAAYALKTLMSDVEQIILALGYKSCVLVAHDWGAFIAWAFARIYSEYVDKLIIMNVPPRPVADIVGRRSKVQRKMSWYMTFFQVPWLPEFTLKIMNFNFIERGFKGANITDPDDIKAYQHVFSRPGALTPPINYYRAILRQFGGPVSYDMKYPMPVLVIWGCKDSYLCREIPDVLEELNPDILVKRIESANHFVQNEEPETVNRIMREWLAA